MNKKGVSINYRDEFTDEVYQIECHECSLMFECQEDFDNHMREVHNEIIAYEDEINEEDE